MFCWNINHLMLRESVASHFSQTCSIKPTLVFPRERRGLSGFAQGQTFVAREKRVAFSSPQNKPFAALLRMCNASPFPSIIYSDFVNVSLYRQIMAYSSIPA
jgi:hypothetical protein